MTTGTRLIPAAAWSMSTRRTPFRVLSSRSTADTCRRQLGRESSRNPCQNSSQPSQLMWRKANRIGLGELVDPDPDRAAGRVGTHDIRRRHERSPAPSGPDGIGRSPATNSGSDSGPTAAGRRDSPMRSGSALSRRRCSVVDHFDCVAIATPPARHLLHRLIEDLDVLHGEVTAHREVMERPGPTGGHHVESGEIAAGGTAIAGQLGDARRAWGQVIRWSPATR